MERIAYKISLLLMENDIIRRDDCELCKYGIELFLISVLEICVVLLLAMIVGNFVQTVVFLAGFLPIRMYSGGYHADTRLRCFIILLAVYVLFCTATLYIPMEVFRMLVLPISVATVVSVGVLAPMDHDSKNVSKREKQSYKTICIILTVAESVFVTVMLFLGKYGTYMQILTLSLLTAFISLIAGKIKNFSRRKKERRDLNGKGKEAAKNSCM